MAAFAPVAPPEILRKMRDQGDFVIGAYHLVLAHDIVARPKEYEGLFPRGAMIILDNSVIELGKPVDVQMLIEAAYIVQPRLVVLPDEIGNQQSTLQASVATANRVSLPPKTAWMAVPQGQTLDELKQCAQVMLKEIENLGAWGVGRFITAMLGSRLPFTRWLASAEYNPPSKTSIGSIHLLGFSDNVDDDFNASQVYNVMGIDSAVPVRMGQRKKMFSLDQGAIEPRGDFWENPGEVLEPETLANLYLVRGWFHGQRRRSAVPPEHEVVKQRAVDVRQPPELSSKPIASAIGTVDQPLL